MTMLTLFGKDISRLTYNELKREKRVQKALLTIVRKAAQLEAYKQDTKKRANTIQINEDKVAFFNIYGTHLEALISQIDYYMMHRSEPLENFTKHRSQKAIRQENERKRKACINENRKRYEWEKSIERDACPVSWDKERFMLIANDRGYQTEEAVVHAIGKELNLDRPRAKTLLDKGRFTWGQVLCLGAFMQMTPREFCDTFLAGYFTEEFGEYAANYENIQKTELLKTAIRPLPPMQEVVVGADGRPLEDWFED